MDEKAEKLTSMNGGDFDNGTLTTINIGEGVPPKQFVGLSKEELKRYENDPFWKRIRLGLFIGFWALWFILLVSAILILVYTPPCPETINLAWSRKNPGYAVNVAKFVKPLHKAGNSENFKSNLRVLASTLNYPKSIGFNYLILTDDWLSYLNTVNLNEFNQLREAAIKEDLKLVLKITCPDSGVDNKYVCVGKEKAFVNDVVDKVIQELMFDGMFITVGKDDQNFNESLVKEINSKIKSIGRNTMTEKTLLVERSSDTTGILDADVVISKTLLKWSDVQNASILAKEIGSQINSNGWMLDDTDSNRIASRGVNTHDAVHVAFLLPGTPIINYGTEVFLDNKTCVDLEMPWNISSCGDKPNYANVKDLVAEGQSNSLYDLMRLLSDLRNDYPILKFGRLHTIRAIEHNVLHWEIRYNLYNVYTVSVNIGSRYETIPLLSSVGATDKDNCNFTVLYEYNTNFEKNEVINCNARIKSDPGTYLHIPPHGVLVLESSFVHKDAKKGSKKA